MAASAVASVDRPFDPAWWTGRSDQDGAGDTTRYHHARVPWTGDARAGIGLIGFACDEGVRRNGDAPVPRGGYRQRSGLRVFANLAVHHGTPANDCGDIAGNALEASTVRLAAALGEIAGRPHLDCPRRRARSRLWECGLELSAPGPARMLIVNFDAHFDLRADLRGDVRHAVSPDRS